MKLEFKKIVKSSIDNTLKYIFYTEDKLIIEFSYLNKNDGKDIICVSCQTMCNIGCKFCHTTDFIGKIRNRNIKSDEIIYGIDYIYTDLKLSNDKKTLLISFMGCGEPTLNVDNIIDTMIHIKKSYVDIYTRFAFATSLPKNNIVDFFKMSNLINKNKLPVKLHISLHYTTDELRLKWMPNSLDIIPTISAANFYKVLTNNAVEIHYAMLDEINDTTDDAIRLTKLIKNMNFNVKFLFYNRKDSIKAEASNLNKVNTFTKFFDVAGIKSEYYKPVGLDIGASCGQFLMEEYINKKVDD